MDPFTLGSMLVLLQTKHLFIDWIFQSEKEVKGKGIWGNIDGFWHSYKHGISTIIVLLPFTHLSLIPFLFLFLLGWGEMVIHYLIDYTKSQLSKGITTQENGFWRLMGVDQYLHQLTYIFILLILGIFL